MEDNKLINLILDELTKLNDNYEGLRKELQDFKNEYAKDGVTRTAVVTLKEWKDKVDDIMSPSQMKELKDEVYKQKNRWTATIAILTFIQILIGIIVSAKNKIF